MMDRDLLNLWRPSVDISTSSMYVAPKFPNEFS